VYPSIVHLLREGYEKVVDLLEKEFDKFSSGLASRKRPADGSLCS
jgi:hypothetical protein